MKDLFETVVGTDHAQPEFLARHLGFEGTLPLVWSAGGGVLFGGFGVAALTLVGRLSGAGLFVTAGALFVLGAVFGFVHGGVLAWLGRDRQRSDADVLTALGRSVLFSIPVLAVTWAMAGWIALTDVAVYMNRPLPLFGAGIGWLLGIGVLVIALAFGSRGLRQAYARWDDSRAGTILVGVGFVALLATFLVDRPDLWWTGRPVGMPGPVLLAAGVTVWLIGPAVTFSLWALRKLPEEAPPLLGRDGTHAGVGLLVALGAGGVLGLGVHLAFGGYGVLPLALWTGSAGEAVLFAVGQALLDELLLRMLVVVGIVWAVREWSGVTGPAVVIAAVAAAAFVQLLVYLPGISAIGFPTTGLEVGYGAVAILLPGLVFGGIFWWRGFAAAVVAHTATVVVAALLAL